MKGLFTMKSSAQALIVTLILSPIFSFSHAFATEYKIDKAHSSVTFRIRHLVSKTRGEFKNFDGSFFYTEGKPAEWKASGTVMVASVDTNDEKRDKHLRSPDFFDVEKFAKAEFAATKFKFKKNKGKAEGTLTLHGVTKPITFDMEVYGLQMDPMGNQKIGFSASTILKRKDFGIVFNKVLDKGGLMLGEDVELNIEFEGAPEAAKK